MPLVEGIDYTVENGNVVFTAAYLLARGTCCGSGCRNCPYPKANATDDCGPKCLDGREERDRGL